jgi:hypothetical protein
MLSYECVRWAEWSDAIPVSGLLTTTPALACQCYARAAETLLDESLEGDSIA